MLNDKDCMIDEKRKAEIIKYIDDRHSRGLTELPPFEETPTTKRFDKLINNDEDIRKEFNLSKNDSVCSTREILKLSRGFLKRQHESTLIEDYVNANS